MSCLFERVADGTTPLRLLPDGSTDLVWIEDRGALVYGAASGVRVIDLAAGARVSGVRFRPGAGPGLLGVPGETIRDGVVPVADVWGEAGRRWSGGWDGEVTVTDLAAVLLPRARRERRPDPLVSEAIRRLRAGEPSVARLAAGLAMSERHLRRRFHAAVGLSPKQTSRILRLQHALRALNPHDDLTRTALEAGYADHSHFVHECVTLSGLTPGLLLRGRPKPTSGRPGGPVRIRE